MIPGLGGMNPKKMQGMLKQMGINQEEIDAEEVIIKTSSKTFTISNPSVQKITMQGQTSFQVAGEVTESEAEKFSEDDVKLVMEKSSCTEDLARKALEETGDIAEAIMKLSE
jgi:nascent polypeptide-associated complex subunit alpha